MCHIFWLIVGCVEVVHSAYEACIHNGEVLIGECHIDDELRLVTVEELYELGNAVGVHDISTYIWLADGFNHSLTL